MAWPPLPTIPACRRPGTPGRIPPPERRGRYGGRWLSLQPVDALDRQEQNERDDHEVDQRLQERAVLQHHRHAVGTGADRGGRLLEIHPRQRQSERRHDDVRNERTDDLAERGADHDTDREVDDVALHRKLFEFRAQSHGDLPERCSWWGAVVAREAAYGNSVTGANSRGGPELEPGANGPAE